MCPKQISLKGEILLIRQHLINKNILAEKNFTWRGGEISRLEGFSDAVFAFAVTLLVVSLEVPHTFNELLITMRGFFAFAFCFASLIIIWYNHYLYFRRYGLQDFHTMLINMFLLFVVLFYIYPLKFLTTLLLDVFFGFAQYNDISTMISAEQMPLLMVIYSGGFFLVFFFFFLLYYRAYKKKDELQLSTTELIITRSHIISFIIYMSVALLSILLALIIGIGNMAIAGWIYVLLGPAHSINGRITKKKISKAISEEFK